MMMDSFQDDNNNWDLDPDYSSVIDHSVPDAFYWNNQRDLTEEDCSRAGAKAFRKKIRRETMNDRFTDLSSILEPGKPPKSDKSTIITDAMHAVNQLRSDAQELRETNNKLGEDIIKRLKAEKHELRGSCPCCAYASNKSLPWRSQEDNELTCHTLRRVPHVAMDFSDSYGHNSRPYPQPPVA